MNVLLNRSKIFASGFLFFLLGIVGFMFFAPSKKHVNLPISSINSIASEYVDFDTSMQLPSYKRVLGFSPEFPMIYDSFKSIYEKNSFKKVLPQKSVTIPKVIHIMWLGGKLPNEYEFYVQSWYKHHPDWTILFWTDNDTNYDKGTTVVNSFDALENHLKNNTEKQIVIDVSRIYFDNRFFYDRAVNYGEKSDILKWEIVYRFGGLYVDIDYECYKPMDTFHHMYDFYTGVQPLDTNQVQLGAALYAACPNHPILKECVENIKYNQHIPQIVVKTGPLHFTKCFLTRAGENDSKDVALPASYFYPCGYEEKELPEENWRKTESYAIHHWAGSWLKPEAFVKR